MAVRGARSESVEAWTGLNTFDDLESLPLSAFAASSNVVISPNGNAIALRSPANVNTALSTTNPVLSAAWYDRVAGSILLYDINASSGANVATYSTTGTTNTAERTAQAAARWHSLNVDDKLFRVNGAEFIQYATSLADYNVGLAAPASAPTLSIVSGGSGTLATGVIVSYAYRNSVTGHVGLASTQSSRSAATSAGNNTLRIPVVASAVTGVDGIILFISEDGGSIPYLYTDSSGDPVISANTTANIDISVAVLARNNRVEETQFNETPPAGATYISKWKSRVMLTGFPTAARRGHIVYSGYDQITYGVPYECYPSLNIIPCPVESERMRCGTETPLGWLGLSERDGYLLTGSPSDKVDAGENTLQVTESLDPLGWGIGTRSPYTLVTTPFGDFWLDQDKHLQFWTRSGPPQEVIALRNELASVLDTAAARDMAEAAWFQSGKDGGFYVLTASTSGSTNNKMWFVTVTVRGGQLAITGCPSDVAAQCVFTARDTNGKLRFFIGVTDRLREMLDFDTAGAGWGASQTLFCEVMAGNGTGFFNTLHSIQYRGRNADGIVVQVRESDDTDIETLDPEKFRNTYVATVSPGRESTNHKLRFTFPANDGAKYELSGLTTVGSAKRRITA